VKGYIAIFVCFATRAVHIELVCDCSISTFLNALKRFIVRRGKPSHLYSDNATNFIGANRELRNLFKQANFNTAVVNHLANEQISWHFIPPRSPHMGGLWEAAVKSTKRHLKRVIGNVILNYELNTLLTMIEACLNSRPPVSNDPADFSALTPGHFLIGDALTSPTEPDLVEIPCNRLNRYQLLIKLRQHFWRRAGGLRSISINFNKGRNGPPPSIIPRKTRSWSSEKTTCRHFSGH
jgi:diadenosine tetraphosphate (Ap4A) HIT family hydrolase